MIFENINSQNLKGFEGLLKLCRKQGVSSISFEGITVTFGDMPRKERKAEDSDDGEIPTDELTPEQLMFFSAGGTVG